MNLSRGIALVLKKQIQPVILYSKTGFTENAKGDIEEIVLPAQNLTLPTTSISAQQLVLDGSGKYTTEDRNFYQIENIVPIHEGDELEYNGIRYTVKDIKDYLSADGFILYICKKTQPQPDKRSI